MFISFYKDYLLAVATVMSYPGFRCDHSVSVWKLSICIYYLV